MRSFSASHLEHRTDTRWIWTQKFICYYQRLVHWEIPSRRSLGRLLMGLAREAESVPVAAAVLVRAVARALVRDRVAALVEEFIGLAVGSPPLALFMRWIRSSPRKRTKPSTKASWFSGSP